MAQPVIMVSSMKHGHEMQRLVNYFIMLATFVLIFAGYRHLELPLYRIPDGLYQIWLMLSQRMFPPDLAYAPESLVYPFIETCAMSCIATIFGIALSVPLAWLASANMTPNRLLYVASRLFLVVTRAVHGVVWAMLMVAILGFGPLAGTIALTLAFIGFAGKLVAENVEAVNMRPVEAIRAVGGSRLKQMILGVYPQVRPVWIGLFIYGWDIILRTSFVLGLVGAGGVGVELISSMESLSYHRVGTILLIIIVMVTLGELASMWVRKRVISGNGDSRHEG